MSHYTDYAITEQHKHMQFSQPILNKVVKYMQWKVLQQNYIEYPHFEIDLKFVLCKI